MVIQIKHPRAHKQTRCSWPKIEYLFVHILWYPPSIYLVNNLSKPVLKLPKELRIDEWLFKTKFPFQCVNKIIFPRSRLWLLAPVREFSKIILLLGFYLMQQNTANQPTCSNIICKIMYNPLLPQTHRNKAIQIAQFDMCWIKANIHSKSFEILMHTIMTNVNVYINYHYLDSYFSELWFRTSQMLEIPPPPPLGVVHILRNHFLGSRETPPSPCNIVIIWASPPPPPPYAIL